MAIKISISKKIKTFESIIGISIFRVSRPKFLSSDDIFFIIYSPRSKEITYFRRNDRVITQHA